MPVASGTVAWVVSSPSRSPVNPEGAAEARFEGLFEVLVFDVALTAALVREVIGQFGSGETECEVSGSTRVSVPIAPFARPLHRRGFTNGLGDGVPAIAGDAHAHSDLGV